MPRRQTRAGRPIYLQREGPSLAIAHNRLALPPPAALVGSIELWQGRRPKHNNMIQSPRGLLNVTQPAQASRRRQRHSRCLGCFGASSDSNRHTLTSHIWTSQRPAACLHSQLFGLGYAEQRIGAPRNLQSLQAAGPAAVRTHGSKRRVATQDRQMSPISRHGSQAAPAAAQATSKQAGKRDEWQDPHLRAT